MTKPPAKPLLHFYPNSKSIKMQVKTINKTIRAKIDAWLQSITDEKLREALADNVLVSGGSITSLLLNEPVNDYDIYIMDRGVLLRLTEYYVTPVEGADVWDGAKRAELIASLENNGADLLGSKGQLGSALRNLAPDQVKIHLAGGINGNFGGMKIEHALTKDCDGVIPAEKPYRVAFLSPNAISLSDDLQIVVRFWGDAQAVHKTFDFIHATNYWTHKTGVVNNIPALESIMSKSLRYQGSLYPLTSVIRAKKFINRGWKISAGEYLKMMFQISLLDLTDIDVLEEQLIGVDVAYFSTIIEALRKHKEQNVEFVPTAPYMNTLIDRIFNDEEAE